MLSSAFEQAEYTEMGQPFIHAFRFASFVNNFFLRQCYVNIHKLFVKKTFQCSFTRYFLHQKSIKAPLCFQVRYEGQKERIESIIHAMHELVSAPFVTKGCIKLSWTNLNAVYKEILSYFLPKLIFPPYVRAVLPNVIS